MNTFDKLTALFERFPGIGPRQARRFVFHLLTERRGDVEELAELIAQVKDTMAECEKCFRFYAKNGGGTVCDICQNPERDASLLMVVERDADITPIEKSGTYRGYYFVLGGTVPLLDMEETKKLRGGALKAVVDERLAGGLSEIILAFSVNPDGENTARYIESLLSDYRDKKKLKISTLGRGLSTGSELEYADPETIKNALANRH
jgi:recombination protein RecR